MYILDNDFPDFSSPSPEISPVRADKTAELFSGSDEEGEGPQEEIAESAGSPGDNERGSVGPEEEEGEEREGYKSPRAFGDSQRKRPNPFKVRFRGSPLCDSF